MSNKNPLAVVILAAGKGTRMKSDKPKVMHELLGLPMINWLLNSVEKLNPDRIITVIGQGMDELSNAVSPHETVIQLQQDGTGSALKTAMGALQDFTGDVLVLLGDTPLISVETMQGLVDARHYNSDTAISVLGMYLDNPYGYGRLLIDSDGTLRDIREEKDASEEEKQVNIVNTGAFCLDAAQVNGWLSELVNINASGEYYITDLPEIAARAGVKTSVAISANPKEVQGCNTRINLSELESYAQELMREKFINAGVIMQDPSSVYFYHDTKIEAGTLIEPNIYFGGGVEIGSNVHIKAFCHFEGAKIGNDSVIGPFARLRTGSDIGEQVRIGNFVEIKKSEIGRGSKISHLAYVGDCIMGDNVNFSCGAITVNYDGFDKHKTVIENGAMVGSNVNLVAPVTVGAGAFVAAGSTVTTNVPPDALSVERSKAKTLNGWAAKFRVSKKSKQSS